MSFDTFLNLFAASILTAGLYATMSYGLALIYGVMKLTNLSHAGVLMLAAYGTYWLNTLGISPYLAPFIVVPLWFGIGIVWQHTLVKRIMLMPPIASLLFFFGIWLIMQNFAYLVFKSDIRSITNEATLLTYKLGPLVLSQNRLIVFFAGITALVSLQLFLTRTYQGRAIRALAADAEAARLSGIDTDRISALAFGLGIALAAFAGCLMALIFAFDPEFGRSHLLKSFCIVVLGGLESFVGVALGAIMLALAENFSIQFMPAALQDMVSFVLLVIVLLTIPNGLMSLLKGKK
ncbi:MAG: branched-chain amino acid ABC transporter permease [Chloroflexi bacterium]|nr:branched-chain amino acid ABC transporter permease [Chloroflexota bacterium]